MTENKRTMTALVWAALVVTIYYLFRQLVYMQVGTVRDFSDLLLRETYMALPRTFWFFSSLILIVRYWGRKSISALSNYRHALAIGFILVVIELLNALNEFSRINQFGLIGSLIYLGLTIFVGLAEEFFFRGLVFGLFAEFFGKRIGILISAFLFTFFHVGAQQYWAFPSIFFIGLILGSIRSNGVSLWALALIHILLDANPFIVGIVSPETNLFYLQLFGFSLTATLYWYKFIGFQLQSRWNH
ncbi:MAG: lysostaphin resistance A-like protein [Bacteriovoracia bacterium]